MPLPRRGGKASALRGLSPETGLQPALTLMAT